jgi:regulator of protease activity HflC (stomatin/prohibitin superfamily)
MFWFISGIILTIVAFVALGCKIEDSGYNEHLSWSFKKRQAIALLCLLLCTFSFITKIPANSVGIVYSPFGGTREETLSEGFHTKSPFDSVYKISTEVQTMTVKDLTTQTKDAQFLTTTLDIKYKVNDSNAFIIFKQYKTLDKMSKVFIMPTTQRVLELVTVNYNIIDILGEKRSDVYSELQIALTEEFAKYGIDFYAISIVDMDAGEALEKAITEEAVAKKAVETAEQNLRKAETEAKQKSVQAQAEQDAAIIQSETKLIQAEAERKANELLKQSLSSDILQKEWIDKWDGRMPTYYAGSGDGMGVMLSVN